MERWSNSHSLATRLIQLFAGLLLAFLVLSVGLLCLLHINDTVDFKEGQIYSRTPPAIVRTPTDVRVRRTLVREGDAVRKGDTLFVLENRRLQYDHRTARQDTASLIQKARVARRLLAYLTERQQVLMQQRTLHQQTFDTDWQQNERELAVLATDAATARQQSAISRARYRADSILYTHQAVARTEVAESQSRTLSKRQEMQAARARYEEKQNHRASLRQAFRQQELSLSIELNGLHQQMQQQRRALLDLEAELAGKRNDAAVLGEEEGQLVVRAPADGNVLDLYNTRQATELLPRNEPLAMIAPRQEQFYAKVMLPERELAYVRLHQQVNLKLNAYYYYQYGAVQGRVTFISPANVNDQFFTIVQLAGPPRFPLKSGYKLKGEIITSRYTLLGYAIKKLFDKLDTYHDA
jgi:multidrug efflux pump subunit AcrA (membrane-fusion protein)